MIVNMSVWSDLDALKHFMYRSGHVMYLRRRREWFEKSDVATSVCWWIPAGDIPDLTDAHRRLLHVRARPDRRGLAGEAPDFTRRLTRLPSAVSRQQVVVRQGGRRGRPATPRLLAHRHRYCRSRSLTAAYDAITPLHLRAGFEPPASTGT